MTYRITTPMKYSNTKGESGIFDKRTGKNTLVLITVDNITISPEFEKVGQFLDRLVIRARLVAKPKQFGIPEKYYNFSNKITISGFTTNVDFILQIRLIQTQSVKEKDRALAGQRPKIKTTGSLNQFRFKYVPGLDSSDISGSSGATPQILVPSSEDLLDLPTVFNNIIKPKDSVF